MRTRINQVTGARELETVATFKGWATNAEGEIIEQENVNGNRYRLANVSVVLPNGKGGTQRSNETALVYEGNYEHDDADFQEGEDYLTTVSESTDDSDDRFYTRMSHLTRGVRLTKANFGEAFDSVFEESGEESASVQEVESEVTETVDQETGEVIEETF